MTTIQPGHSTNGLVAEGAHLAYRYAQASAKEGGTTILRSLAHVLVELRARHETSDGVTDWAGRSGDYRSAAASIYEQSRLSEDELTAMQAALRYHVGNVLRAVAPADELAALGMTTKRPVDRVRDTRERLAALARAGAAGGDGAAADPVRMVLAVRVLLERIAAEPKALEALTLQERRQIVRTLDTCEELRATLSERAELPPV